MHRNSLISVFISLVVGLTTIGSVAAQEPQPVAPVEAATLTDATGTPVSAAITYQGQLKQSGSPATGNFDFQFVLYDAASSGSQQGATLKVNNLPVSNGLFNVQLDFGQGVFSGEARFLEVGVKPAGSANTYTVLSPRTELSAVPYALGMPGIAAQNGTLQVSGNISMAGSDFVMLPSSRGDGGRAIVHGGNDTLVLNYDYDFSGGVTIGGRTTIDGDLQMTRNDFVFLPSETGDGGRAIVHGGNDTLVLNYDHDFSGGVTIGGRTTIDGDLQMTRNDFVFLPSETGDGGRAIVHGGNDTLVLNFANDFSGGTLIGSKLQVNGTTRTQILQITGGSDLAELFSQADGTLVEPGTVMVIDPEHAGKLMMSASSYDHKVAGIVSGAGDVNPGLTLQQEGVLDGNLHVAIAGRVYVKAEALSGAIEPGDLLTTSDMVGYAMKATNDELSHGAVIGKAMTGLQDGTGLVLVLVNLQ